MSNMQCCPLSQKTIIIQRIINEPKYYLPTANTDIVKIKVCLFSCTSSILLLELKDVIQWKQKWEASSKSS